MEFVIGRNLIAILFSCIPTLALSKSGGGYVLSRSLKPAPRAFVKVEDKKNRGNNSTSGDNYNFTFEFVIFHMTHAAF